MGQLLIESLDHGFLLFNLLGLLLDLNSQLEINDGLCVGWNVAKRGGRGVGLRILGAGEGKIGRSVG